ncbi:MAG: NUDIX domain-containing protein [Rhodobacteraceae bacterium]|nr:NUDIX domain-containing protein [Paracoccaceae bacterium]
MAEIPVISSLVILMALRSSDRGHEVLLLKRTQSLAGEWCQISGRVEEGEKAWEAALRELKEETGLSAEKMFLTDICETFYGATQNAILIAPVFVAYISRNTEVKLNFEHSEFRWTRFEEAIELVPYGGQRRTLRQIEEEYSKRNPNKYLEIALS